MTTSAAETRVLALLRHCDTEPVRPGARDPERRLTERGHAQARAIGARLRERRLAVDHVLCSPAVRTRQTTEGLALGVEPELVPSLYGAGGDTIVELVRALPDGVRVALLVGHAPGIPAALYDLVDPETSEPTALRAVADRYPSGTLTVLEVRGPWADLANVRLVEAFAS